MEKLTGTYMVPSLINDICIQRLRISSTKQYAAYSATWLRIEAGIFTQEFAGGQTR